jgi:hypothetical protein
MQPGRSNTSLLWIDSGPIGGANTIDIGTQDWYTRNHRAYNKYLILLDLSKLRGNPSLSANTPLKLLRFQFYRSNKAFRKRPVVHRSGHRGLEDDSALGKSEIEVLLVPSARAECESAPKHDPVSTKRIKGLSCRSASGPHADSQSLASRPPSPAQPARRRILAYPDVEAHPVAVPAHPMRNVRYMGTARTGRDRQEEGAQD